MSREHKRVYLTPKQKTRKTNEQEWKCAKCHEDLVEGKIEFDHRVPRWKRPKKAYTKAEEYAGQDALCRPCHVVKTRKEAAERAHHDRLEKERLGKPKRKRAKAKIQSPGFSKTKTMKMNGDVVPKNPKKRRTKQ